MTTETLTLTKKNFCSPEVARHIDRGAVDLLTVEDMTIARITLQPGWRWSQHVRPMAKTEMCTMHHAQCVISGRLHVVMEDGAELELGPGDFVSIPPGHDAWVLGNEPFVCIDFSPDVKDYARGGEEHR